MEPKKTILLVTHELSRTPSLRALLRAARTIREDFGASAVLLSPEGGPMRPDFEEAGAFVLVRPAAFRRAEPFLQYLTAACDNVIINGACSIPFIPLYAPFCKRLHWWLHETEHAFSAALRRRVPETYLAKLAKMPFSVWCASPRIFPSARSLGRPEKLLACGIPEEEEREEAPAFPKARGKLTFLMAGNIREDKGRHIFVNAVGLLPEALRKRAKFLIAGDFPADSPYARSVFDAAAKFQEILIRPETFGDAPDCLNCYGEADILVSAPPPAEPAEPDDPMPLAVTRALMFGMPCIVSDAVGHALLPEAKDVLNIVPAGDAGALSAAMRAFIENPARTAAYRDKARRTFEQYFSVRGFAARLGELLEQDHIYIASPEAGSGRLHPSVSRCPA
jgi:glycosyltransferase involved in cell wall biosynthesis